MFIVSIEGSIRFSKYDRKGKPAITVSMDKVWLKPAGQAMCKSISKLKHWVGINSKSKIKALFVAK